MKIISNGKRKGWIFSKIETATCLLRMQVRFLLAGVRQTAIATVGTLQNWDSDNTFLFAYLFWWQNRSFWSCVWDKRKPVCGRDYNREAEKGIVCIEDIAWDVLDSKPILSGCKQKVYDYFLVIHVKSLKRSHLTESKCDPFFIYLNLCKSNLVVLVFDFAFLEKPSHSYEDFILCNVGQLGNLCYCQRLLCCCKSLIYITSLETYVLCCQYNYTLRSNLLNCWFFVVAVFLVATAFVVFFSVII